MPETTGPQQVAELVDAAVAATPGVARSYRAAPALGGLAPSPVLAHVTVVPSRGVVVSVGVDRAASAREVADAVAAAVRATLPEEWVDCRVKVQVRRIEADGSE